MAVEKYTRYLGISTLLVSTPVTGVRERVRAVVLVRQYILEGVYAVPSGYQLVPVLMLEGTTLSLLSELQQLRDF
jgi:hypothetical protein